MIFFQIELWSSLVGDGGWEDDLLLAGVDHPALELVSLVSHLGSPNALQGRNEEERKEGRKKKKLDELGRNHQSVSRCVPDSWDRKPGDSSRQCWPASFGWVTRREKAIHTPSWGWTPPSARWGWSPQHHCTRAITIRKKQNKTNK